METPWPDGEPLEMTWVEDPVQFECCQKEAKVYARRSGIQIRKEFEQLPEVNCEKIVAIVQQYLDDSLSFKPLNDEEYAIVNPQTWNL